LTYQFTELYSHLMTSSPARGRWRTHHHTWHWLNSLLSHSCCNPCWLRLLEEMTSDGVTSTREKHRAISYTSTHKTTMQATQTHHRGGATKSDLQGEGLWLQNAVLMVQKTNIYKDSQELNNKKFYIASHTYKQPYITDIFLHYVHARYCQQNMSVQ